MPLLRSQVTALVEQAINSLGWAMAAPDAELIKALPNTAPLAVAWRWTLIDTVGLDVQRGAAPYPMQKAITYTIEYVAQVQRGTANQAGFKYLALDLPDILATVLLDRTGPVLGGLPIREDEPRKGSAISVVMGPDSARPPPLINSLGQVSGYLQFTVRAEIDARTALELIQAQEGP